MMTRSPMQLCLLSLSLALGLGACAAQGSGSLTGDWLLLRDCDGVDKDVRLEPLDIELGFMGLEYEALVANLRFAENVGRTVKLDQLNVSISRVDLVREEIDRDGFVELDLDLDDRVRLALAPAASCVTVAHPIAGTQGVLRFEALGVAPGERVTGSASFVLVDGRSGELLGEGIEATFDFEVGSGAPYSAFSNPFVR